MTFEQILEVQIPDEVPLPLDQQYCKSFRFADLETKIKAKLALEYADTIYGVTHSEDDKIDFLWDAKIRDVFTTALLRTNCGCVFEPYFDELLNEWKIMEGHDRGCHRARFVITEDLADSTIKRREKRERSHNNEGLLHVEERFHATTA